MKTIIAAVDFSNITNAVADHAIALARALKGRLIFLHVVPPPAAIRDVLPAVEDVALRRLSTGNEADRKLAELKHGLQRKFHGIELLRLSGPPVATLVEEAQKLRADYLVLGSHGHTAVHDALIGSVAAGVARKAPCPVLLVPPITARGQPENAATHEPATA